MKNGRMVASRYAMSLVVSVMCLMMASCSGSKPIEVSDNDQSRFDETTKELRKKAQGGDASAQNELGLLYYEGRGVGQNYRKDFQECLRDEFAQQIPVVVPTGFEPVSEP